MNILNIIARIKPAAVLAGAGLLVLGLGACNKDFGFKLDFDKEAEQNPIRSTEYKVAYIILEGGVGNIVAKEATDFGRMPTLAGLSTTAMVSWNGVSAENKDLLTSYADLLTGAEYDKHKVITTSMTSDLQHYPVLFKRVSEQSSIRRSFISSNSTLGTLVRAQDVDDYQIVSSDAEVTDNAVAQLQGDNAGLTVATFKGVDEAGKLTGYDSENYKEALATFDGQLKRITAAIYGRKNYASERWLIIVASTKGGHYTLPPYQNDGSVFAEPERNNFVLISNPNFAFKLYERMQTVDPAWTSSAVKYSGSSGSAVLPVDKATLYNLGSGVDAGDYTIQLKLKVHEMNGRNGKGGTAQNGVILGKMKNAANFPAGWSITYNGGSGWRFIANSATAGNYAVDGGLFELDAWYTLTVKIYKDGTNRTVKMFRDGVLKSTYTNFSGRNLTSNDPLQMGFQEGSFGTNGGFVHSIADVRIYKAAIPDEVITAMSCTTMPVPSSPFYSNLIGYWPANDNGSELKDLSGNKRNFDLTGTYSWTSFSERGATLCPTLPDHLERFVVRSVDIPRLVYNWFNFTDIASYNLDSQIWNPAFTNP